MLRRAQSAAEKIAYLPRISITIARDRNHARARMRNRPLLFFFLLQRSFFHCQLLLSSAATVSPLLFSLSLSLSSAFILRRIRDYVLLVRDCCCLWELLQLREERTCVSAAERLLFRMLRRAASGGVYIYSFSSNAQLLLNAPRSFFANFRTLLHQRNVESSFFVQIILQ